MKKNFLLIQVSLLGLLASSCAREELTPSHDDVPSGFEVVDFVAGPEDFTKTAISGDGDAKEVSWVKGDQITIFYDGGSTTAQASGNGMTASFRATVPSGKNLYAVYPSDAATFADNTLSVSVPSVQDGTFSLVHRAVSKMKTDGSVSTFYNATSFFKIVVNDATYTKLVVSALGTDKINAPDICGKVAYTFDSYGNPTAGAVSEGGSKITMNLSGKGTYYVTMLPDAALAQGVLVECYKGAERVNSYYVNRNIQVPRSVVASFGDIAERASKLYVTVDGAGTKSGKDWANAMDKNGFINLVGYDSDHATALAKAAMLDGVTIYMGEGTYSYNEMIVLECTQGSETVNYTIDGGYYNGVKDAQNHPTVFSGNNAHAIFYVGENMNITFDDCQFVNSLGSKTNDAAVKLSSPDAVITMNRCVFDHNTNSARSGALGIANGYAYLNDCVFTNNTASKGAAFCVDNAGCGGEVVVNGGRFENNTATTYGGCISIFGGGPLTVTGATFTGNSAANNGGVFSNQYSEVSTTFVDCDFNTNSAKHGGAVFTKTYSATFNNCRFDGNVANGTGTAQGDGGAVCVTSSSASDFNGCSFTNNKAANGGAVEIEGSAIPQFKNYHSIKSTFSGNTATKGGAVYLIGASSTASISDADISNNTSTADGGAIFVENGVVDLHACTVSGNKGVDGGAMCIVYGAKVTADQSCSFASNTASGNGGAVYIERPGSKLTASSAAFNSNSSSRQGGAICAKNSDTSGEALVTLSSCSFDKNSATTDGGAILAVGKANVIINGTSSFTNNHSSAFGGALAATTGSASTISSFTISGTSEFKDNYSSKDGGAIHIRSTAASSIKGASFIGNNVKNTKCGGGAVLVYKGDVTIEDCYFKGNYTPQSSANDYGGAIMVGDRGTGTSEGGTIIAKINHCFFESNHAFGGGAIALGDTQAKVYANACSFKGDYCKDTNCGTTMYVWAGSELCLNNCTILDGTYQSVLGSTGSSCAWIYVNNANCQTVLSNSSLIGEVRSTDGSTKKIWVNNNAAILHMKNNTKNNHWSINSIITSISEGVRCIYSESAATWTSYYTKRASTSGGTWNSNSSDGYACNGTTNYFGGLNMQSSGTTPDTNYWAWNGTMSNIPSGSKNGKAMLADVKNKINSANAEFYTWLDTIGALDKDQLGNTRGTTTWPGAYDGTNR